MTFEEIHEFGINIVQKHIEKEGYIVKAIMPDVTKNPQIVATKNNQGVFILVRTACYPEKGVLESPDFKSQFIEYSTSRGYLAYFASVGICNADGTNDLEMSIPIRGAGYYISYEGLVKLSTTSVNSETESPPIHLFDKDGNIAGGVSRDENGRNTINANGKFDSSSMLMSLCLTSVNDLTDSEKIIFSKWAGLPTNSWTDTHRKESSLALMHFFMEAKTNPQYTSPKLYSILRVLPAQTLAPLKQPLTNEIRKLLAGLFGQ